MTEAEIVDESALEVQPRERAVVDAETFGLVLADEQSKRRMMEAYIRDELKPERDWGQIGPRGKPTLLKPGAEKIAKCMRLRPVFERDTETLEMLMGESPGTLAYRCLLYTASGELYAEGRGSCSPDERAVINTRIKIALKRAMVDAVLRAAALSDQFTQDLEDTPPAPQPRAAAPRPAPPGAEPAPPETAKPAKAPGRGDFEKRLGFGKYKDLTWRQMTEFSWCGQHHNYLQWLSESTADATDPRGKQKHRYANECLKIINARQDAKIAEEERRNQARDAQDARAEEPPPIQDEEF